MDIREDLGEQDHHELIRQQMLPKVARRNYTRQPDVTK